MDKIFKIVKIISEYRVVVNAGRDDLINEDAILVVFVQGDIVKDPDSGETLGTLDFVKAKLRVVDVFPKMCVCENRESEMSQALSGLTLQPFGTNLPLNVDATDISGGFENVNKKIKIGDLVRKA